MYFIHGDETLLVNECADAIRAATRAQGFSDRQVFNAEPGFDWNHLAAASDSLSLFSEQRMLELRLPTGKPGKEGAAVLADYAARPAPDTVLLVLSAKLESAARNSKWVRALDKAGVAIAVWPVDAAHMPAWIDRRMQARGMQPERDALQMLAERVEGNLLAAAQEIERLYLLHGAGPLGVETIADQVSDNARYDVFVLVDRVLAGDAAHAQRVLAGLRAEGVDPVLVLWALAREIRMLASMARDIQGGATLARVLASQRVWEKRKPLITGVLKRIRGRRWWALLQRCAAIDRIIKGRAAGSAWDELLQLSLELAGAPVIRASA